MKPFSPGTRRRRREAALDLPPTPPEPQEPALLLEDGFYLLLEDGSRLLLES